MRCLFSYQQWIETELTFVPVHLLPLCLCSYNDQLPTYQKSSDTVWISCSKLSKVPQMPSLLIITKMVWYDLTLDLVSGIIFSLWLHQLNPNHTTLYVFPQICQTCFLPLHPVWSVLMWFSPGWCTVPSQFTYSSSQNSFQKDIYVYSIIHHFLNLTHILSVFSQSILYVNVSGP